jgi:hypothetical protein
VPNWHGFGLGQQRSDLLRCLGGDARDNEQRLLRFLQVGSGGGRCSYRRKVGGENTKVWLCHLHSFILRSVN